MAWFVGHDRNLLPVLAALGCFGGFLAADLIRPRQDQALHESRSGAYAMSYESESGRGFAPMIEGVRSAVISIRARTPDDVDRSVVRGPSRGPGPGAPRYRIAQGSGFFISEDGYAVTNNHVVAGSSTIEVRTDAERSYKARLVAADPESDLALLKVDGSAHFPHVSFSRRQPRVGEWVLAVGNPFGLGGTVTAGIVSASGRDLANDKDLLQIDAPVNRGNSGGPTFDLSGHVVGVNSMILSPSGGSIGLGFAIPASRAERVVTQLKAKGSVTRGWLGMHVQTVSTELATAMGLADASGVVVADVLPDGPAARAGMQIGDVITSIDQRPLANAHALNGLLEDTEPGTPISMQIARAGVTTVVKGVVESAPPPPGSRDHQALETAHLKEGAHRLGLSLAPASESIGKGGGVVVVGIDPGGLAAGRGIEMGDVILEVDHRQVNKPEEVFELLDGATKGEKEWVLLRFKSGENSRFAALPTS